MQSWDSLCDSLEMRCKINVARASVESESNITDETSQGEGIKKTNQPSKQRFWDSTALEKFLFRKIFTCCEK